MKPAVQVSRPDAERAAAHLLRRDDLREFHYQWQRVRTAQQEGRPHPVLDDHHRHGPAWSESGAWTHCICFGAAGKAVEPLLALLAALVDTEPCRYDHDGNCQTHFLDERPCPHEQARLMLDG